ncbi:MAG: hypothetical protein Q8P46_06835 [Hyphomicrobiales bacterium]|nr:hypothetical protein [Hyphomicrobiales bacterium]
MNDLTAFRRGRIEKLLYELRHEIGRGMLEHEIDERMGFRFYVPLSRIVPDGVVFCEFRTFPIHRSEMGAEDAGPRLRLVKSDLEEKA